ncbi:MAG: hypothetical protein N2036_11725 [Bryobacteraceae bacterium]|nr:hypothetical protein [Bryobacteraceae bacterium]
MSLRIFAAVLLLACSAAAQEPPVAGYFSDGRGALRALVGVQGAWQAPALVPTGVESGGFVERLLWYKTANRLWIRMESGEWMVFEVPEGPAAAMFHRERGTWLFHFPTTNEVAEWNPAAESLVFGADDPDLPPPSQWPEVIGEGYVLERAENALFVKDAEGRTSAVPLADAPVFQLLLVEGGQEKPVGNSFVMPPAAPGDSSTARFRVRNTGSIAVVITRLSIDPGPFRTFDQFFPPRTIAPGDFADFWVRFAPEAPGEYSRTLYINDLKVTLLGSSQGLPVVELETASGWQTLKAGEAAQLGSVERRSVLSRRIRVTPAVPLSVTGEGFQIQADSQAGYYNLSFSSDKVGFARGNVVEGQRTFPVEVTVTDFPTPTPSVELLDEPGPARQIRFRVKLSEAARTNLSVAVSVSFLPDTGLPDDTAVMLLPNSIRTMPLSIAEGAASSGEILLQTGTTAGLIQIRASIGSKTGAASFRIAPGAVALTSAKASVASANAEVVLTGYDTVRSASRLAFTFYLKSGQAAAPGRIEVDAAAQFSEYYRSISGSAFRLRAHFPVSGTHTELDSVEVEVFNSVGRVSTGRLRLE